MSKITKWKLEKTKVKVVFRLQFHATHIPQTGWDKLFISFIPSDSGKATAKTTKASVRNGTCKWADPIYETTRLLQDAKSKQYDEKLYKLVVSMGSSRTSILGEATINLADYADASKPSAVSLPLHGSNSGTVIHVTVQLLTSKTGFREFEQQRELRERGLQSGAEGRHDDSSSGKEIASNQLDKANARIRFKDAKELSSFEEEAGSHEEYADSTLGFDDSSNTSESLYAEKHDSSSAHEIDSLRSTVSGDLNGLPQCQSLQTVKGDLSDSRLMVQGSSDSGNGWPSDSSVDNDLAMIYEENHKLRGSLELAESTIFELKQEISSLQSQANEIGIETQKFSHFLASEISSGEEMAKEVSLLKAECLKFKDDIERLKNFKMNPQVTGREGSRTEHHHLLQDRQLNWINGILSFENRIRELQHKTYLGFHERDIRFLHSELEELLRILQDIKQGTGESASSLNIVPSERTDVEEIREACLSKNDQLASGTELDLDLSLPESLLNHLSIPPLVSQETDSIGSIDAMKRKISDFMGELDEAKAERENLARKMVQMECYYEALIQELEENQKQMLGELQNLRNEHSTCLYTISANKAEMESTRQDMTQQLLQLSEERHDLDALNKELERRATMSEAALKRARLNYSIAVNKLQKDLELLSSQVVSMFETNENLVKQAFSESAQTQSLEYLNMFQNPEDSEAASLMQCQNPNASFRKQPLGGDILLEDLKKSLYLQEELYQKVEEELCEMQFVNLHLDIFSKTLQETLLEANADIGCMKQNLDELAQHLELSNMAQDQLIIRLQTAMEDIRILNDYKASCIAKFSDMALENQTLEANLENVRNENSLLVQKVADFEAIMSESRSYQRKYEACFAEKAELSNLLKWENTENVKLQNEISLLKDELKTSKAELDELAFVKDNLQENVSFVQDKLASMLIFYDQQFKVSSLLTDSHCLDFEVNNLKSAVFQLEEIQYNVFNKIREEKKNQDVERVFSETSLSAARSEILAIKQKSKSDIQKMAAKLNVSNALVERLQFGLESLANKLHLSSDVEEKYAQQNKELLADLALFEVELQKMTSKHGLLAEEIMGLKDLAEELGMSKTAIADLTQEKQGLLMSLQDKMQESIKLSSERDCLAENLRFLNDELQVERIIKEKLEDTVQELTSQLYKMQEKLLECDQQRAELVHFRQQSSDLELEKSRLNCLLLQRDECLEKIRGEQLLQMDDYMLASDVKFTFLLNQYETSCLEFVRHIKSSDVCLEELQKRQHEVEAMLEQSSVSEARYREENVKLTMTVKSLSSELEVSVAQNKFSSDANDVIRIQLEDYKKKLEVLEAGYIKDKEQQALLVEQLKNSLANAEAETDYLTLSKEELEITMTVLKDKLDEQSASISMTEEYKDKIVMLQSQCNEVTHKLSEQVLKTEEFKNLSIHLKELKDKAEAECLLAREKREPEGLPVAQESLRIAFIKEQYETRVQELRQQLSISKKHGEELLLKLQDAIVEIENRKKSEALHLQRNEELSLKLLELEADLQSTLSDKWEKIKAYDTLKAELDCAVLTFECCKEEKEKLEASLQECVEEKTKIAIELTRTKGQLEHVASSIKIHKEENGGMKKAGHVPDESTGNLLPHYLNKDTSVYKEKVEHVSSIQGGDGEDSCLSFKGQAVQEAVTKGFRGINEDALLGGVLQLTDEEPLNVSNAHLNNNNLRSSMEHLHEELERMKNENSLLPKNHQIDPDFQVLQGEIMRLHNANEELRNVFPLFDEISSSGNALERVLALEIELAESLRAKSKSNIHFQSSFLKQHSDEEAVLKSFRDIHELIKEMLELKGRHAALETELKEMHDRYSQLSLQFAEVEGERQKLKMTLKNVRASRKQHLNRSSSAAIAELSP